MPAWARNQKQTRGVRCHLTSLSGGSHGRISPEQKNRKRKLNELHIKKGCLAHPTELDRGVPDYNDNQIAYMAIPLAPAYTFNAAVTLPNLSCLAEQMQAIALPGAAMADIEDPFHWHQKYINFPGLVTIMVTAVAA